MFLCIKNNKIVNIIASDDASIEETKKHLEGVYDDIVLYISHQDVWEKYGVSEYFPKAEITDTVTPNDATILNP